jgi:hypothetical protein
MVIERLFAYGNGLGFSSSYNMAGRPASGARLSHCANWEQIGVKTTDIPSPNWWRQTLPG